VKLPDWKTEGTRQGRYHGKRPELTTKLGAGDSLLIERPYIPIGEKLKRGRRRRNRGTALPQRSAEGPEGVQLSLTPSDFIDRHPHPGF